MIMEHLVDDLPVEWWNSRGYDLIHVNVLLSDLSIMEGSLLGQLIAF